MKTSSRRPRTATINLSDFMRIQNEIIPSKNAAVERKNYDEKLKTASRAHILNFPDSKVKNFNEKQKEKFLRDEMRKRQIDQIEREYQQREKNLVNMRAKKINFENQDDIKSFHSQLLVSDCLNERRFQEDIKRQKKQMEDNLNKRYHEMEIEKMREYDKNEELKKQKEEMKKRERMQIIDDQIKEMKFKRLQDYQEKEVEGILMKAEIEKNLEEDKKKEEEIKKNQKFQMEEFVKANEALQQKKKEKIEKEKEEDRKIELYAMKKEKLEDLKKKVAKENFDRKQAERQKMIDAQIKNLAEIKQNQERILEKQVKEAEEKKEKEEEIKKQRYDKLFKEMQENRELKRKQNQEKKLKQKKEDLAFMDSWKDRMKQLERDEKEEQMQIKKRNKELAEFQKSQYAEKKKKAVDEFKKITDRAYVTEKMIKDEEDDYMEYVMRWVEQYKREGKDIKPLIIEINKWRKRHGME